MKRLFSLILTLALAAGLLGAVPAHAEQIPDVTRYSYSITPVLSPFPYALYVKTDNPDPTSFRLVDADSVYYGEGDHSEIHEQISDNTAYFTEVDPGTYYIDRNLHPDVAYENESIRRVPGGYIFITRRAFSDGGTFALMQKTQSGASYRTDQFRKTDVTVSCPKLKNLYDYLLDTYTSADKTLFENLNALQNALDQIAVYPRGLYDVSRPNESRPYPFLVGSPYRELALNEHYEMFLPEHGGLLTSYAYPFILDSLGFPGVLRSLAKRLDPNCEVAAGNNHYTIQVTCGGETHSYGGAGSGGRDPLYTNRVAPVFTFLGGVDDLAANATVQTVYEHLMGYETAAQQDAQAYRDLIAGTTYWDTIAATGGTWIRIAVEGFGYGTSFAYVVPLGGGVMTLSDAWVDGRYVNEYERVVPGERFADHPTSQIVVHDVTYQDRNGVTHTQDVVYFYDQANDRWIAPYFYNNSSWYSTSMKLPDALILTREQVEAMEVDRDTAHLPDAGLIYDGTAAPGTPFSGSMVTGAQAPETLEITVGETVEVPVAFQPSTAMDQRVRWTSSDPEIVSIPEYGDSCIHGAKPGTAVITGTTFDGGYTVTCTVTVKSSCDQTGHKWDAGKVTQEPTETAEGVKTFTCTVCGETRTESVPKLTPKPPAPANPFNDVAQGQYYYDPVQWAVNHQPQITNGTSPTTFSPDATCTRGQVVTFLWRAKGCPEPTQTKNPFTDVAPDAYYYKAVLWAVEQGVTNGTSPTTFGPDQSCTRGQVVTFLWRAEGKPVQSGAKNAFTDVQSGQYYYDAVLWAVAQGITNGTSPTTFSPDATCTRGQIVTFLYRDMK